MAEYKGIIKKWKNTESIWDVLYPKTTIDQVVGLSSALADIQSDIEWAIDNITPGNVSAVSSKTTWAITDVNQFFRLTNSSSITITIPTDATINYAIGTEIHFMRFGAGEVTIARATGVTLYSEGSASDNAGKKRINAQMQVVTIKKVAANMWVLFGALKT